MGKDCPFVHPQKKQRSSTPPRKEKGKTEWSDKGKALVAIVNLANRCSTCTSLKHPRATQDKPWASRALHYTDEGILTQKETTVTKGEHKILAWKGGKSNAQRQISISERNPDSYQQIRDTSMHHHMTRGLQSGMRSKKSLQGSKHTRLSTKQTSSGVTFPQRRSIPHSKERKYIVDSGDSLHMMGLSSLHDQEKKNYHTGLNFNRQV